MPRPVLRRNNAMAEVVEKLKLKDISGASATYYSSELGDVECDICTGSREKAVKSCLVCLASFCKTHLVSHFESPVFKKHKLVQACKHLQDKVCARHDKLVDFYCRTDQKIICALCMLDDHKGHNATSVASERTEKQKQIRDMRRKSQQKILEKEKKLQDLKQAVNTLKSSSQAAVEENERIFTELFTFIQEKCYEITELIREQEKVELDQAVGLQKQLEQEIADLKKKDTDLELLLDTEDHVHFLQDLPRMTINQHISFDGVRKSLSDLKEQFEEFCKKEFNKINPNDFCHLTLDPNTANEALWLSDNYRKVSRSGGSNQYPSHPDRFGGYGQVLCKQSVSGRCYWEVEWSRGGWVYISVSYKGICRKGRGKECWFGHNAQSWSLECSSTLSVWHNDVQTKICGPLSFRIGVYLDHSAGTLSFFSVSDTMTLLHRVQTMFTEALYPGFWVNALATAKLCYSVE
ncbi:E3 ubiquitin/ISG15 ligase TRIM25 [Silurus asotus]|uniref:E3 ubiquitin/ISG15 ligase TRIM25 n=1 Tax=Silurus asotus TaxID=30991 RepID=A0AAD5FPK7_SILAS|nr:E3 ubiquitin/ISG15 ligase TRIM25 [Silurus asotus]